MLSSSSHMACRCRPAVASSLKPLALCMQVPSKPWLLAEEGGDPAAAYAYAAAKAHAAAQGHETISEVTPTA